MYIFDKSLLEVTDFLGDFTLEIFNLLLLVVFPLSLLSQLFGLVCPSDIILSFFEFICILSDILMMVFVHVLKAAVLSTVSLILFEDIVHDVFTILLILPAVRPGVAPVLAGLRGVLVFLVEGLVVIILAVCGFGIRALA